MENGKNAAKMDDFYIAAKTGTSRKPNSNAVGYSNKLYTSMVGYFPASDPRVVLYVIVDSPNGAGIWGSTVAAPVFKEISTELVRILNLNPDKNDKNKLFK
jgi:cell division protein FtsI/penicillin-binding protein 2